MGAIKRRQIDLFEATEYRALTAEREHLQLALLRTRARPHARRGEITRIERRLAAVTLHLMQFEYGGRQ